MFSRVAKGDLSRKMRLITPSLSLGNHMFVQVPCFLSCFVVVVVVFPESSIAFTTHMPLRHEVLITSVSCTHSSYKQLFFLLGM